MEQQAVYGQVSDNVKEAFHSIVLNDQCRKHRASGASDDRHLSFSAACLPGMVPVQIELSACSGNSPAHGPCTIVWMSRRIPQTADPAQQSFRIQYPAVPSTLPGGRGQQMQQHISTHNKSSGEGGF